jgi:hypothetical protein
MIQVPLHRLSQVGNQMIAIGNLESIWSSLSCPVLQMEDTVCRLAAFTFLFWGTKTSSGAWNTEIHLMLAHYVPNDGKYLFRIGNGGRYLFRIDHRKSHFSSNMDQKAASICSESGDFLLPFARPHSHQRGHD